ncbi:M56 family metallopeptidase [Anthocerotibacter panamensis]|uniref:M56 family metallopeptidase n=1 Tax=Anthocerotibacter panamensis TaxID=2857077 RepID=UPI001C408093|nr:M56 family metallopeptidase [Anthocerotibacter panamensis]
MHVILMLLSLAAAWMGRMYTVQGAWQGRWSRTRNQFLLPPCTLLTTAVAILWMGPEGTTLGPWDGWLTYGLAGLFLLWVGAVGLKLAWAVLSVRRQMATYPPVMVLDNPGRLLDSPHPFIAQVGFWRPQLLVSRGLLATLSPQHLEAVLAHEAAHDHYHDTFWFFWLGWMARATGWLPNSALLWRELLALRELRADRWATARVEPLLLAEALVQLSGAAHHLDQEYLCASVVSSPHYLVERVEVLLQQPAPPAPDPCVSWFWLLLPLVPLGMVPFHTHLCLLFC